MSSDLEDIFQLIVKSEQKVEEKKKLITDAQNEIESCLDAMSKIESDVAICKKRLTEQEEEFAAAKQHEKFMVNKAGILETQLEQIVSKNKDLLQQIETVNRKLESGRETFGNNVQSFSSTYDFSGKGRYQREEATKEEIKRIKICQKELRREIEELQRNIDERNKMKREMDELNKRRLHLDELKNELEASMLATQKLEEERLKVSNFPYDDVEYKSLHEELEANREGTMEGVCQMLQQELHQLQHQLRLKQMQGGLKKDQFEWP